VTRSAVVCSMLLFLGSTAYAHEEVVHHNPHPAESRKPHETTSRQPHAVTQHGKPNKPVHATGLHSKGAKVSKH
jgi:hypothetical protein